jgi:hypothetical protein
MLDSSFVAAVQKSVEPFIFKIHSTPEQEIIVLAPGAGQPAQVKYIDLPSFKREHQILNLESFISLLASASIPGDTEDTPGLVMVSEDRVSARLRYGSADTHRATMTLRQSQEFLALQELSSGVNQHTLWTLLQTALWECVDDARVNLIADLEFSTTTRATSSITMVGINNKTNANEVRIEFPGCADKPAQDRSIPIEWDFNIRLWDALDTRYTIATRLLISNDGTFRFLPRRLSDTIRQGLNDIIAELRKGIPKRFTVHAGII